MLTAYARECERAGVRVASWREMTSCRHVRPFKYSAEHLASLENSVTLDNNATFNEVLKINELNVGGVEEYDDYEAELDISMVGNAMAAYRPSSRKGGRKVEKQEEKRRKVLERKERKRQRQEERRRRKQREKKRRRAERESENSTVLFVVATGRMAAPRHQHVVAVSRSEMEENNSRLVVTNTRHGVCKGAARG